MVIGLTTELMDLVFTIILMEPSMKDSGLKISSMEKVLKPGQMVQFIKANIKKEKKKAMESSSGVIRPPMRVILAITISMVLLFDNLGFGEYIWSDHRKYKG
jgi:hypothetical protein